jgi:hypothetical protein
MLDENEAKKLYETITGEDQNGVPVLRKNLKIAPEFRPRHTVYLKVLQELKGVRVFRGGTDKDWENIKKLAEQWHKLASDNHMVNSDMPIVRLGFDEVENIYSYITKAWTFREHGAKYTNEGDMFFDAYQVVKDAIRERSKKKEGLAVLEYEVLKAGGMLLGTYYMPSESNKLCLLVLFESISKSVMDKLMDGEKTKKKRGHKKHLGMDWASTQPVNIPSVWTNPISPQPNYTVTWGNSGGAAGGSYVSMGGGASGAAGYGGNYNYTVVTNNVTTRFT